MVKKAVATKPVGLSPSVITKLYRALLTPRLIEERMLLLLRQGRVSKWFSGIGQEAIAVGVTQALQSTDYILPLHRNLGVFTSREMPLSRLISQWQGTEAGYTKGRDRSFHFGTREHHIVGMISHLGPQLCVADGIALGELLNETGAITAVFSGDGGTSEGDFHEALNVAAVWKLPVLFVIENNGYALSTPSADQFCCKQLADRAIGYGMEGQTIDGNNLVEVYETVSKLAASMRSNPRPVLLECMTFRMRGHEEASGVKYVPPELIAKWKKKDPIARFEQYLTEGDRLSKDKRAEIRSEILQMIDQAVEEAFARPPIASTPEAELADVYAPHESTVVFPGGSRTERRFIDALNDAHAEALIRHPDLVLMGQDIAEYGGVFKVTDGLCKRFGPARVRNTPLCESAILGAAFGLSVAGRCSIVEMQFADFVSCGFNQIVNNLAKSHYRWGQPASVVVRLPTGAGSGAGPYHSQSNEAWFFHVPGLKIVYPANPEDAKGLLLAAVEDPNPVLFFEHKGLYRSSSAVIPDGYYTTPIGVGRRAREGKGCTIITYGMGVRWALDYAERHPEADPLIVDLRTLLPWDKDIVRDAVHATGRVLVLHEDTLVGGIGGEISAWIGEHCFSALDAPVLRCASLDTPVPFAAALEKNFLASARLDAVAAQLLSY